MRERIMELLELDIDSWDIIGDIEEKVSDLSTEFNIEECKVVLENVFDSSSYDVYCFTVAWIDNGKLELITESIAIS